MPEQSTGGRPYADEGELVASLNAIRELIAGNRREYMEKFDHLTVLVERVETQTIKTNGRVRVLEMWRAFTNGAIAVLTLLFGSGLAWIVFLGGGK